MKWENEISDIAFPKIEFNLKNKEFISSLDPVRLKAFLALVTLKEGWKSLASLRVHEAILLLEDNSIKDLQNESLLVEVLQQLRIKQVLDPEGLEFLQFLQSK